MTSCTAASKVSASVAFDLMPGGGKTTGVLSRSHIAHQCVQDVMIFAFATPHVGGVEFKLIAIHALTLLSHSFVTDSMASNGQQDQLRLLNELCSIAIELELLPD